MTTAATKWTVLVKAGTEIEEFTVSGRPNMAEGWVMFLLRSDDGSNFVTAAFPTHSVVAITVDGK